MPSEVEASPARRRSRNLLAARLGMTVALVLLLSCATAPHNDRALLDDLEQRTFHFFWDLADPHTYLIPDRAPTESFSSIAAVGFGLTAYGIGAERGFVTREQAAQRTLATLQSLLAMKQAAHKGFYYHFLDMKTGDRFKDVELSTVDTALMMAGILFSQSYFDRDNATEKSIRDAAETLYTRVEWDWAQARPPAISMGWTPEQGFHTYDWRGYNEAMIVIILALGSPTHPVDSSAWAEYHKTDKWGTFEGQSHFLFAPLFGHQYSQVWIDFRGIQDANIRAHGIDYFENSRRASIAQHAYGVAKYGDALWGLTACDGPHDYAARGATEGDIRDDGTIAPTAAVSSMPFTPELSMPAMKSMIKIPGLYRQYGFADAFNRSRNWIDKDYLGIDQGPIIAMVENYQSGLVWKVMRKNQHIVRGLKRAGFCGGWLDECRIQNAE
ncbi:MAG TPA: glucoamylase family protein [Thermoanaerobaculia bacterium]|nr:glucoamylase family protein [Thermoanaerobaculia bacterium]